MWHFNNYTVNVSDDIYIGGYIYGNGSQLTDISQAETDPYWTANYSTFLTHISWAEIINGTFLGEIWNTLGNGTMATTAYVGIQNTSLVNYIGTVNTSVTNTFGSYVPYTGALSNVVLGVHNFSVDTNTLFVNKENGRVGIGTTGPGAKLEIGDEK